LKGEPFASAPQSCLNFIADKKGAVFAAKRLGLDKIIVLWIFAAFALHQFDHERSHIVFAQLCFQRSEITRFDTAETGKKWTKSFMKIGIHGGGKRAISETV